VTHPALWFFLLQNGLSYSSEIVRECQGDADKATASILSSYLFNIKPKKLHNAKTSLFSCADDVGHNLQANVFKFLEKCQSRRRQNW